jgi:hypothetical protein
MWRLGAATRTGEPPELEGSSVAADRWRAAPASAVPLPGCAGRAGYSSWLLVVLVAVVHHRLGPSSSATTSTVERALPFSAVQARCWSRPTTTTRLPLASDCAACRNLEARGPPGARPVRQLNADPANRPRTAHGSSKPPSPNPPYPIMTADAARLHRRTRRTQSSVPIDHHRGHAQLTTTLRRRFLAGLLASRPQPSERLSRVAGS